MDTKFILRIDSDGSIHVIPEEKTSSFVSASIILICFILGFMLNSIVSLTIIFDRSLRSKSFNMVVLYVCTAAFSDCTLNESTAFAFAISWKVKVTFWCKLSSAASEFSLIIHTFSVLFLCVERSLSLTGHKNLLSTKIKQINLVGGSSWILAAILVTPVLCDVSSVRYFHNRYACGIVVGSIWYSVSLLTTGTFLPWLITLLITVYSGVRLRSQLSDHSHARVSYTEHTFLRLAYTILLLYAFLLLPHIVDLAVAKLTSNSDYSIENGIIETVFTWSRYQYNIIVPTVVLILHKGLRKQCALLFCFWRYQNSVADLESLSLSIQKKQKIRTIKGRNVCQNTMDANTPVLFATSDGLCLRTASYSKEACTKSRRNEYVCRLCDMTVNVPGLQNEQACANRKNVRFATAVSEIRTVSESGISCAPEDLANSIDQACCAKEGLSVDSSSGTLNDTFTISRR